MPDAVRFLTELAVSQDVLFSADAVVLWPEGFFDELLGQGLLVPAEAATHVTCDACSDKHVEEVVFIESPPDSGIRAFIMCPEAGRVRVDLNLLRQWATNKSELETYLAAVSANAGGDGSRFMFKREAELWRVNFGNEQGSFKPIDGLVYIAHLLGNPSHKFSGEEMKRLTADSGSIASARFLAGGSQEILDGQVGVTNGTRQVAADQKAIQDCKNRLAEIAVEIDAARKDGQIEKLDDLEEEETKINKYLAQARNIRGRSRPLANSQRSLFNSVKQAIDRAVKKFTSANPPLLQLNEHLLKALDSSNGVFEYRPSRPGPAWEL